MSTPLQGPLLGNNAHMVVADELAENDAQSCMATYTFEGRDPMPKEWYAERIKQSMALLKEATCAALDLGAQKRTSVNPPGWEPEPGWWVKEALARSQPPQTHSCAMEFLK